MKIALYAGMFKKDQDGSTKTLYRLAHSLLDRGFQLQVWAFSISGIQRRNLRLHCLPSLPLPLYPDYRISLPLPGCWKKLRAFRPDIIHITVPDLAGLSLLRYARRHHIPIITSYHTDFPSYLKSYHLGFLKNLLLRYFRWFYNHSRGVMAPTRKIINQLQSLGIRQADLWGRGIHSRVYHPGNRSTDLRRRWKAENKTVILFAGRFVWYKALDTLIEVYRQFQESSHARKVQFILAGDGPIAAALRARMPAARFTGYLGEEELARVYASADVFLFPSATETFGNVVLEALSSGLPSVVSDVGGCCEIIQKSRGGIVCPAGDSHRFFQACVELIRDSRLCRKYRDNGLRYARTQDWEQINQRVVDRYRLILHRWGKRKIPTDPALVSEP